MFEHMSKSRIFFCDFFPLCIHGLLSSCLFLLLLVARDGHMARRPPPSATSRCDHVSRHFGGGTDGLSIRLSLASLSRFPRGRSSNDGIRSRKAHVAFNMIQPALKLRLSEFRLHHVASCSSNESWYRSMRR